MENNKIVSFRDVKLADGFWKNRYELNKNVSIGAVRNKFEESARFDALRFNYLKNGRAIHYFYDSDAAKWIEGVAYLIEHDRASQKDNEAFIDELVDCMEAAQRDNGYLNSYHQQIAPDEIFKDRNHHELYCAGHLIEAAVAYDRATGKDKFLKVMEKYCDCIYRAFIEEKTAAFTTPGHEEIELAADRLFFVQHAVELMQMAAQAHGLLVHRRLVRVDRGLGDDARLVDVRALEHLTHTREQLFAVLRDALGRALLDLAD